MSTSLYELYGHCPNCGMPLRPVDLNPDGDEDVGELHCIFCGRPLNRRIRES